MKLLNKIQTYRLLIKEVYCRLKFHRILSGLSSLQFLNFLESRIQGRGFGIESKVTSFPAFAEKVK